MSTDTGIWDDPEIKAGGEYVRFEKPGDSISGTIVAIRKHKFDDGKVVPQVLLVTDDGEERTMTAGQVQLKARLAEERPIAGDHVTVSLIREEKRAGGKTLKHFSVTVTRGNAATPADPVGATSNVPLPVDSSGHPVLSQPQTPAPAAPAAPTVDAAALAAAMQNLTPEQKAALGL